MPRETLDRQIDNLKDEIILLGSMVEQATLNSIDALKRRDLEAAHQIYEDDYLINEKRYAIENAILILIATQQPLARDLRLLAAMMVVITELERMGDYAKGISKVIMKLGAADIVIPIRKINQMAELALNMLHRALNAFIAENPNEASVIPLEDDQVDALYNQIYHTLVDSMISNPASIDQINLLMWVVHNLERLADRVTNICERTVFIVTGEILEMDSMDEEDYDF